MSPKNLWMKTVLVFKPAVQGASDLHRVCPLNGKAITLEQQHNLLGRYAMFIPTVHSDQCTGCGKCEHACVLDAAAIRVLPRQLAKGEK